MFDLLGYWSIVSALTFTVMLPIAILLYHAIILMVGRILEDDWEGKEAVHKIIRVHDEDGIYYKGEVVVNPWIMWVSIVSGAVTVICTIVYMFDTATTFGLSLVYAVHVGATLAAPVGLYLAIPLALYHVIIVGGRKYIKVKAKLAIISNKLKEMDND